MKNSDNSQLSTVHPQFKMTEVGVIPEDWEQVCLGELFIFRNGLNKEKEFFGYGTPIVNYMDVFSRPVIRSSSLEGRVFLSKHEIKNFDVRKGDVFFTRTSETTDEIGMASVMLDVPTDTVFSGFVLRARPLNQRLDDEFKAYCFSSSLVRKQIISKASYTTRALTNGGILSQVLLPTPPLPEQRAIATALSDVDALLAAQDKLIAKKRDIKQAAMQQLLTGKKRLPGFGGEWEVKTIKSIVQIPVTDGPHMTPQFFDTGIPFLSVNNLVGNKIDLSDLRYISQQDHEEFSKKCKPRKGDLLLGKAASVGKVAIVDTDMEFNIWSPIALIRFGFENVSRFIYYQFQTASLSQQIALLTNSSSQGNIGMGDIEKLEVKLPSYEEQTAIASVLSDMDTELAALEKQRDKTRAVKFGMMQVLLTGKIRLTAN